MSCFHPLTGFYTGYKTDKGNDELIVTSADRHFLPVYMAVKKVGHNICYNPDFVVVHDGESCLYKTVSIPCGHCKGCLKDRSLDWAVRCSLELKDTSGPSWFVTLTMDDAHLQPPSKDFVQKFLKRLRKRFGRFRYLLCAEYGKHTLRPHYHAIFFGLDVPDLVPYSRSGTFQLYRSKSFEDVYRLGGCLFGKVTFDSCAYVAKYATKSEKNLGCFLMMSRRPGIGSRCLKAKVDSYDGDSRFIGDFGNGRHVVRYPRLFKSYFRDSDPDAYRKFSAVAQDRAASASVSSAAMHGIDVDDLGDYNERLLESSLKCRNGNL